MTESLLTVADLCERLSVKPDWAYQAVHRREIPFIKLGHRSLRFDAKAIEAWLCQKSEGYEER